MTSPFEPMTVADIVDEFIEGENPFRWEAFDGSSTGPADAKYTVSINSPEGLSYIVTAPGDVGLARAFVTEGLTVEGEHLAHPYGIFDSLRELYRKMKKPDFRTMAKILRSLGSMGAIQVQPIPEVEEASWLERTIRQGLSKHSKERDADVISAHYDVGNDFYELFLGDSMTYTCAIYPHENATLEQAQENKYRTIFDKLGLKAGDRHLDVGCGWGGMVRYAARQGVHSIGVTLSKEQAEWAQAKIKEEGLEEFAEVRYQDYRDVSESEFDGISAIGILEHVGVDNYPQFFEFLQSKVHVGGKILNHCITYPDNHKTAKGTFIDRYIFPDGELTGSGTITQAMQDVGLEVVHTETFRFDYMRTLRDWCENLKENWDKGVELVGLPTAKLYGMYMAGSEWGFEHNVVSLYHFLGVKLPEDGTRENTPERRWWKDITAEEFYSA